VPRYAVNGLGRQLLLAGASLTAIAAVAGNGVEAVPSAHGSQVMLYVSGSPWSNAGLLPRLGLRVERLRALASSELAAIAPAQSAVLVDLQVRARSDVRVEFGRRVVWDVTRGTLAPQSNPAGTTIGVPMRGVPLPEAAGLHPGEPGYAGMTGLVGNLTRRRQLAGGSIAPADSSIPSRWPPTQRWAPEYHALSGR
jgi:hypothetical protein